MHREVKQNKAGRCPKCGMRLVLTTSLNTAWKNYIPLIMIIGLIILTTLVVGLRDAQTSGVNVKNLVSNFMIGFFLIFGGFKLLDLKGFAQGYSTYDLLAQRFYSYGFIYPFIELFFGFTMIMFPESRNILVAELLIMSFSGLGVAIKIAKKEQFQCVCLGTVLKVPLTKVTLIEDFGMAALALLMLTAF